MPGIKEPTHGLTKEELRKLFPEASQAFIDAQVGGPGKRNVYPTIGGTLVAIRPVDEGLRASQPEPAPRNKRKAVVRPGPREEASRRRLVVIFTVRSRRPCDWDNYWVKGLQDALVHSGLMESDSWKHVKGGTVWTEKVHRAEDEGTLIEILEA